MKNWHFIAILLLLVAAGFTWVGQDPYVTLFVIGAAATLTTGIMVIDSVLALRADQSRKPKPALKFDLPGAMKPCSRIDESTGKEREARKLMYQALRAFKEADKLHQQAGANYRTDRCDRFAVDLIRLLGPGLIYGKYESIIVAMDLLESKARYNEVAGYLKKN